MRSGGTVSKIQNSVPPERIRGGVVILVEILGDNLVCAQ